jgi:hypothetical protein
MTDTHQPGSHSPSIVCATCPPRQAGQRVIRITHHDWRTDDAAITRPWGVTVDGTEVERCETVGSAGDSARWHAARTERDGGTAVIDWDIQQA